MKQKPKTSTPSSSCDIVTFVGEFKNLAQRAAWQLGVLGAFWQTGFWDRFIRREEQVESVVSYVLNNPVRGGLVERWQDYPYCGSLVFELQWTKGPSAGDKPPPYICGRKWFVIAHSAGDEPPPYICGRDGHHLALGVEHPFSRRRR